MSRCTSIRALISDLKTNQKYIYINFTWIPELAKIRKNLFANSVTKSTVQLLPVPNAEALICDFKTFIFYQLKNIRNKYWSVWKQITFDNDKKKLFFYIADFT